MSDISPIGIQGIKGVVNQIMWGISHFTNWDMRHERREIIPYTGCLTFGQLTYNTRVWCNHLMQGLFHFTNEHTKSMEKNTAEPAKR
ncbi:hypothetical protein EGT74_03490 [Chitinophaga lutea]|uniref:Uncharacterized protein n=1 Tax=Chitinophaga lutea TaxID=2488634 RepID=A0A3N4QLS0_9BACT|nr:hypothetical protein EGT74_03490 [Chitinophaga lutea]